MAGLYGVVTSGPTTLAASSDYVLACGQAPTNHRLRVHSVTVSLRGTGAADPPVLVKFGVSSGISGTALTTSKRFSTDNETLATDSGGSFPWKSSGTLTTVLHQDFQHIQTSRTYFFPAGTAQEMPIPGGTDWLVQITTGSGVTASPVAYCTVNFEE